MVLPKRWKWDSTRYKAARLIAGGMLYREVAEQVPFAESTLKRWMSESKDFRGYIDKLTLEQEQSTRAGIVRLLLRGISVKVEEMESDKDTCLAYIKALSDVIDEVEEQDTELTVTFK